MPKIALVCCSDPVKKEQLKEIDLIIEQLSGSGAEVTAVGISDTISSFGSYSGENRAKKLCRLFADESITDIIDVSGGDLSNTLLPLLDYEVIASSAARFWGYSDLTAIINAIFAKTGKSSVLYNIKNISGAFRHEQLSSVTELLNNCGTSLTRISGSFINGSKISGKLIGGNTRCFLKLAGTQYFPDPDGRVLLLEALGGGEYRIASYLAQLEQLGVFERINGIILGTFTELQRQKGADAVCELVLSCTHGRLPVYKTEEIGHGGSSRAAVIGERIDLMLPD